DGPAPARGPRPGPGLVDETTRLTRALAGLGRPVGGIIVNRMLPRALFAGGTPPPPDGLAPALVARLRRAHAELATLAARQEAVLAPLVEGTAAPVLAEVPLLPGDLGSLADLEALARHLFPAPAAAPDSAVPVGPGCRRPPR